MKKLLSFLLLFSFVGAVAQPLQPAEWKVKNVSDGVAYYTFSGVDAISGAPQEVFVVDWDTSAPGYALRFTWTPAGCVTSDVFKRERAVVAMNAAYEPESVVVKVDGHYHSCMPKDIVMNDPVPNWKSEAAVYVDAGGRDVGINFSGKGLSIADQRAFYAKAPWKNILTSSPMLIDDYEPVGAFFMDSTLTAEAIGKYHYEDPVRHQGVRHPRTAVALTENGHFLMIAVDGRKKGISEGMSARELTRFLERHFHPQYALNMDGGGSTTLCVEGEGDPVTHVVNYPTGNKKYDHAGERRLYSHFCLVRVPDDLYAPFRPETVQGKFAPRSAVREEVLADWNKSSGLDCIYDLSEKKLTPAPKGYEPVFVSHYGRHGSRFAYTEKAYSILLDMLRKASAKGNLTPYGEELLSQMEVFWKKARYQVGDLTALGWEQHRQIAKTMVKSFPAAFQAGSRVDACSSPSVRSIISMSSCISSIAKEAPKASVYAHQGLLDVQATRPNTGKNPFRYQGPRAPFPYAESSEEYFLRRFPEYNKVLGRMFKDPVKALGNRNVWDVFFNLYMFVGGMNSLPEDVRFDVSQLLTREEYAVLWETDSYERFIEYLPYRIPVCSIIDDIIAKSDARLAAADRGADLRFGHDHVVLSLLMAMGVEGFGIIPYNADDLPFWFQTFRSPMGANLQLVFYQPKGKKAGDTLVKLLLNGEEARFSQMDTVQGPYYRWEDLRKYLQDRVSLFVTR